MGEIVCAGGVSHHPRFVAVAREDGAAAAEIRRLYAEVGKHIEAARPDVLVIISVDHFHLFFTHLPTFAIGVAHETEGPADRPDLPAYRAAVDYSLARHLHHSLVGAAFDMTVSQEFSLDHAFMVPYHFLGDRLGVPIVPLFINAFQPPTPSGRRCFHLGIAIKRAVEAHDGAKRVAVLASGSVSLDLGGIHPGPSDVHPAFAFDGMPDGEWVDKVVQLLRAGDFDGLVASATPEQLARAGNVGTELLPWLAMLGTLGAHQPRFVERQGTLGHVFAAWA